jgi:glucose/arabinose dehydrogenase
MERIAAGLDFPTSLAFDAQGTLYVAESGLPFGGAAPGGRVLRVGHDGAREVVREGLRHPVNGLCWHPTGPGNEGGGFYVSEGGHPGRIGWLTPEGEYTPVLDGLPGMGNYHTNMARVGPDGKLYFTVGAMTNMGVIGLDAYELGWLKRLPHNHDVPGFDLVLSGQNFETDDPVTGQPRATTGPFQPFGTPCAAGQRVPAGSPGRVATASVLRCALDGSNLELVAWGVRNGYGLCFTAEGGDGGDGSGIRLLVTDQGPDDRGSRPIGNAPDLLYEIPMDLGEGGPSWFGWPDFVGGVPVDDPAFRPTRGPAPRAILANHHQLPLPQKPLLRFPVNAAATKLAMLDPDTALVALFGDERPMTAPYQKDGERVGRSVARLELQKDSATLHPTGWGPFHRPIDVALTPDGKSALVLDFGEFEMDAERGVVARAGSGAVWRVALGC